MAYAERVRLARHSASKAAPARVGAVVPVFASLRFETVARAALEHVDELVLVDDGAPPNIKRGLAELATEPRVTVVQMPRNVGKATAVAAGTRFLLDRLDGADAIVVLDSDCQHPTGLIPEFVAASRDADVVIGNRADRHGMPLSRRAANALANGVLSLLTRRCVRDSQNGMRLYRVETLRRVPLAPGRYEDERRHLRALLRRHRRVAWVEMPTVYNGEPSSFRLVNGLGDGPEWVYDAFDPHTRNYVALLAITVAVAVVMLRNPATCWARPSP